MSRELSKRMTKRKVCPECGALERNAAQREAERRNKEVEAILIELEDVELPDGIRGFLDGIATWIENAYPLTDAQYEAVLRTYRKNRSTPA